MVHFSILISLSSSVGGGKDAVAEMAGEKERKKERRLNKIQCRHPGADFRLWG